MLCNAIAMVADVMTTQLYIMSAYVVSMVVDVMTTQGMYAIWAYVKANDGWCNYHKSAVILGLVLKYFTKPNCIYVVYIYIYIYHDTCAIYVAAIIVSYHQFYQFLLSLHRLRDN